MNPFKNFEQGVDTLTQVERNAVTFGYGFGCIAGMYPMIKIMGGDFSWERSSTATSTQQPSRGHLDGSVGEIFVAIGAHQASGLIGVVALLAATKGVKRILPSSTR